jgi:hypothetical protein
LTGSTGDTVLWVFRVGSEIAESGRDAFGAESAGGEHPLHVAPHLGRLTGGTDLRARRSRVQEGERLSMRLPIRSGAIRWAMIALAVMILCGCAASGSSDSASSSDTTTANSSSPGPTSSSTQGAPATAPPGPLQTVQLYWHDIGAQNDDAAYRYLAPGSVTQTAADFAS